MLLALLLACDANPPRPPVPESACFGKFLESADGAFRVILHEPAAPGRRFDVVRAGRRVGRLQLETLEASLNEIDLWRVRATPGLRHGDFLTLPR